MTSRQGNTAGARRLSFCCSPAIQQRAIATRRTHGDGCAIAHGLDLVGERWALLVVRELLLGPKRFTNLKNGLPNASPYVISERLRELERAVSSGETSSPR